MNEDTITIQEMTQCMNAHTWFAQLLSHELALQNKLRAATTGLQYSDSKQDHVDRHKVTRDHGMILITHPHTKPQTHKLRLSQIQTQFKHRSAAPLPHYYNIRWLRI